MNATLLPLEDLSYLCPWIKGTKGKIHQGLLKVLTNQRIHIDMLQQLALCTQKRVFVVGYGLAGNVAQLVTFLLLELVKANPERRGQIRCVTFSSPLIANGELAQYPCNSIMDNLIRYVHRSYPTQFTNLVYESDVIFKLQLLLSRHGKKLPERQKIFFGSFVESFSTFNPCTKFNLQALRENCRKLLSYEDTPVTGKQQQKVYLYITELFAWLHTNYLIDATDSTMDASYSGLLTKLQSCTIELCNKVRCLSTTLTSISALLCILPQLGTAVCLQ
jgi:hypothetical protein